MDRFKFRVWREEEKRFLDSDNFLLHQDGCLYYESHGKLNNFAFIEQCTGLKDKNGKLIYEGDIVKDDIGLIAPVCFDEVNAMFYINEYIGVYDYPFAYFYHYDSKEELEVIGNIHENADLLGEE